MPGKGFRLLWQFQNSGVAVLNQGEFWQCLETFLLGTAIGSQPEDILQVSGVIFLESATGTQWVEFKDAAKQPAMHRKPPTTKTYSAKIDNSVEIEKTLL